MAFMSYSNPAYSAYVQNAAGDGSGPVSNNPGLVMMDGRAYLVEKGRRFDGALNADGFPDQQSGADDWMWRDQKTGQEYYLSDYADKGAKLYDPGLLADRGTYDRGVYNRGGFDSGAWLVGLSGNDGTSAKNYMDVAEGADDLDSLAYLAKVSPQVRKQIFEAAGLGGVTDLNADHIAALERTMYKIDPMTLGSAYINAGDTSPASAWGQASMGGVDPMYARRGPNAGGEYFEHPEKLKFDPNYGLYNDGSAGFVGRPKQSALQQGMPFILAAGALMGGAAGGLFGDPVSVAGAASADAIGTGAELGFGNAIANSNVVSGAGLASHSATGAGAMNMGGGGLLNIPSVTGNQYLDRFLFQAGKGLLFPSNGVAGGDMAGNGYGGPTQQPAITAGGYARPMY